MNAHAARSLRPFALIALPLLAGCAQHAGESAQAGPGTSAATHPGWTAIVDDKPQAVPATGMGDAATVDAIIDEGKNHSQVMAHLFYLTHDIGPRLTGSKRVREANDWCASQYTKWGLTNVHVEQWGEVPTQFNRGPSTGAVYIARGTSDDAVKVRDLEFTTPSWTAGTNGPVRAAIVRMPQTEEEYAAAKDKLKGAWVLLKAPRPDATGSTFRNTNAVGLRDLVEARKKIDGGGKMDDLPINDRVLLSGIAGIVSAARDERVITGGDRNVEADHVEPVSFVTIRRSDYDFINTCMSEGSTVELEFNLKHEFVKGPIPVYNTIAEIRGTTWPDQVVIVCGHLDSWDGPGSQGATDNGTGTVTTLETARILAAVGAKPKRTIRFIDWTGEEQGLLGSRAYVKAHADEMKNISAVLVDDGGTNYDGGLTCYKTMAPMLAAATAPINNIFFDDVTGKPLNCNIKPLDDGLGQGGGSDHVSFDDVDVPGFFWNETGRADYPYGHHTQYDTITLAIPVYLQQSATCAAVTAYRLACADTLLPRMPESVRLAEQERRRGNGGNGGRGSGGPRGGTGGAAPATPPTTATPAGSAQPK